MYTLYARKGAGSFVVEALLAELGLPVRIIDAVPRPDGRPHAGLARLNPLAQVPTLVLADGTVMTESAAMVIHLADRHPKAGLAPPARSKQRPVYLRWLLFLAAEVYPAFLRFYYPERYGADPAAAAGIRAAAAAALERDWDIVARALGRGPWVLGRRFCAADLYAAMLVTWMEDQAAFARRQPRLAALAAAVRARPRIAPVWAANGMP
jgi:glutathione S-transferase